MQDRISNQRRFFWFISFVFSIIGTILCIAILLVDREYQKPLPPHQIGNRPGFVKQMKEKGFPFSFLVISDTHNDERAYVLLKEMVRGSDASFMIHVGDAVSSPNLWMHRYFLKKMIEEVQPPFPVFFAAGNHDIYYGFQTVPEDRRVTESVFESLYGARSFDFTYNHCLFILCGVDLKRPEVSVDDLKSVLSKQAAGKKHIFIFFHFPPSAVIPGFYFPREKEFLSLLESYKVTACFFGHYHGYRHLQTHGTDMIVLGGGGGPLKSWQSDWGKFHHGLKITVDEDGLTEDIMTLPKEVIFHHSLSWWIVVDLLPLIHNKIWTVYLFAFGFLVGAYGSLRAVRSTGRTKNILKGQG